MFHELEKLDTIFNKIALRQSAFQAFTEILDFFLAPFRYHDTREELESVLQMLQAHPRKEALVEFLTEWGALNGEGFKDPLGEFYMMHFANAKKGQYFTPENICDLMAQVNIGDSATDGQRVLDPACGSGRTLLAAAKINRRMLFYGADVDPVCCKMAVMNFRVNSMTGEIAHMNSLTNRFFRGYHLSTALINGYHRPFFRDSWIQTKVLSGCALLQKTTRPPRVRRATPHPPSR